MTGSGQHYFSDANFKKSQLTDKKEQLFPLILPNSLKKRGNNRKKLRFKQFSVVEDTLRPKSIILTKSLFPKLLSPS